MHSPSSEQAATRIRGRPWPKGVSGNPDGRRGGRFQRLFADLASELGPLDAVGRAQLSQAVRLMLQLEREKDAAVAVKLSSESRRLLALLRKRPAKQSTLRERLAAEAGKGV